MPTARGIPKLVSHAGTDDARSSLSSLMGLGTILVWYASRHVWYAIYGAIYIVIMAVYHILSFPYSPSNQMFIFNK